MNFNSFTCYGLQSKKNTRLGSKTNPFKDLRENKDKIRSGFGIDLIAITNEDYFKAISELRKVAAKTSYAMKSPIMPYMQIEEKLKTEFSLWFLYAG